MATLLTLNDSQTKWTARHQDSDIGALRFSPDGKFLAITCFNGYAYVRNSSRSRITGHYLVSAENSPILSVKWGPKNQDQLFFSAADGTISSWSIQGEKELWSIKEEGNTVNSIDISPSGEFLASVGSDSVVRLYDVETQKIIKNLSTTSYIQGKVTGHTNRVFATFYINENLFASGGWDNTVILWDARSGSVVRSIFGPSICGNGITAVNGEKTLVTGSWRGEKQLQFWDIGTGNNEKSVNVGASPKELYVDAVATTTNKLFVACGGSHANRVSFFRVSDYAHVFQSAIQPSEITDLDFNNRQFAFGLADSTVAVDTYSMK